MFERWFLAHPRTVGESYTTHQRAALGFALTLFAAAFACLVHAVIPGLFQSTASRKIARLHLAISTHRRAASAAPQAMDSNPSVL